jgi:hypothetical protein
MHVYIHKYTYTHTYIHCGYAGLRHEYNIFIPVRKKHIGLRIKPVLTGTNLHLNPKAYELVWESKNRR